MIAETSYKEKHTNAFVADWVNEMAAMCKPDQIVWCDGSEAEKDRLIAQAVQEKELIPLNQKALPGCYLHRSDPNDVARTEHLTFICTRNQEDAGPTNNWMDPKEAYAKLKGLFDGCMKGRTMYVVPFIMGPARSPFSKVEIELTDSIYVVLSMRIMARMGKVAFDQLGNTNSFTRSLHSKFDLKMEHRLICHFPEDNAIWSIGSDYGGNALLGKKCMALRIASFLGRTENWLAEHMLILGIEKPNGEVRYIAAAFPSQCGKTNLAMVEPPASIKGYKIWTVGDDIAWLRIGPDGRLWAVNPEAGFFGVAPGTNKKTNPNAIAAIQKNTVFTNVALRPDGTVWWEGLENPPAEALDWRGWPWTPSSGEKAAQANSRFTVPASQCPSISSEWENPNGVPISAIIFGGRRAKVAPLVYETFDWKHGVYAGATMASETTAAATGQVGVVRRDPMAMLPFCGYNIGDYFAHWLEMGEKIKEKPKIFHVNWFRTDEKGNYIWPGFSENLRVLLWILERAENRGEGKKTAIGFEPTYQAFHREGLNLSEADFNKLFSIDKKEWLMEVESQNEFFGKIGKRLPEEILDQQKALKERLENLA